jgi:thioesterase domain-containing protein/acyl carrier protein
LGQDILAAVVLHPDAQATESALQDFAARRIARFKIPRRMLFLEHIPKGATGKPNRAALSERFSAATFKPETGTQGLVAQPVPYPASNSLTEPSRTRLERDLAAIWKEVLGIPEIGIHDDFFDLGGHSLMAAHMLARVEQAFGRKLTLDRLIHAPTIRSLAGLIGETEGDVEGSRIVPIQPEGSQPPFFMIRPLPIFRPLAHRLPHDRPFLGVALPEREQLPEQYDLRDVARKLVQAVCRRQPSGPYYLAGWCADGVLAYEMAQQLEAQGKRVALLVLFDSPSPAYWKQLSQWGSLSSKLQLLVWNARFQSASLRQLGKKEIPGYVMQRIKALFILAREKTFHLLRVSRQSVKGRRKDAWRPTGLRVRIGGYETRPIKGKLVLFRSSGWRLGASRDPSFGWGEIAGARLAIHRVPGDHLSIFLEPNVRQLAEKLACHLSEPPLVSPDSPISLTVMSHSRLVNDRRREPRRGAS